MSRSRLSSIAPSPAASTRACASSRPGWSGWGMCRSTGKYALQSIFTEKLTSARQLVQKNCFPYLISPVSHREVRRKLRCSWHHPMSGTNCAIQGIWLSTRCGHGWRHWEFPSKKVSLVHHMVFTDPSKTLSYSGTLQIYYLEPLHIVMNISVARRVFDLPG